MRPTIHSLYSYPVKSCAGIAHTRIRISEAGAAYDRHWVVVDGGGIFLSCP